MEHIVVGYWSLLHVAAYFHFEIKIDFIENNGCRFATSAAARSTAARGAAGYATCSKLVTLALLSFSGTETRLSLVSNSSRG